VSTGPARRLVPVVCVGDVMTDVLAVARAPLAAGSDTASRVVVAGGGAAANTAAWLAVAGHPVTFVGRVGDDVFGRTAVAELTATGVSVRAAVDRGHPTGTCVVVVTQDGSRSMFPDTGANAALVAADLPADAFTTAAHLHLSGYTLLTEGSRPAGLAALDLARAAGMSISVDPGSAGPIGRVGAAAMLGWVRGVDLLLANADEAELLAGRPGDPSAAADHLAGIVGEVVVKLGAGGATWTRAGADRRHAPAVAIDVVDTTGAGDAFAAGFLPGWLAGDDPGEALRAGCRVAAAAVGRPGARPTAPPGADRSR